MILPVMNKFLSGKLIGCWYTQVHGSMPLERVLFKETVIVLQISISSFRSETCIFSYSTCHRLLLETVSINYSGLCSHLIVLIHRTSNFIKHVCQMSKGRHIRLCVIGCIVCGWPAWNVTSGRQRRPSQENGAAEWQWQVYPRTGTKK